MKEIAIHAPRVTYYKGGAERYILNLLLELARGKFKICLITYDAPKKTEWFLKFKKEFEGDIYLLKSEKLDKNFKLFVNASISDTWDRESRIFGEELSEFYKKKNFQKIVCHYCVDCLSVPEDKKIYLHLHGLPDKKRKIENKAIKIPDKIIAVSKYVGNGWKKLYNIEKGIKIVQNAIYLSKNLLKDKEDFIIYFGRLIKIKGVDTLLRAIKELNKNNIYPKVLIVGHGPERENLIKLSKDLDLKKISFIEKINDKKLYNLISCSMISVFPSYKREGIMTTLLEASKYGSVIIASDSCSNREFIINNKNGILFKPQDYKDLASKIKYVMEKKNLRRKLSKNAFKTLKKFTWKKQAKKLEKIYN